MQVFESLYAKAPAYDLTLNQIYERIQSPPDNGAAILELRACTNPKARKKLKQSLPIYMPSAIIGDSKAEVKSHTGYLFYDFDLDSPEDAAQLKKRLASVRFAALFYTSPSGDGVHVLVRAEGISVENHAEVWQTCKGDILKIVGRKYQEYCDKSVKNANRVVFLSYDPEAIYRPDAPAYKFAPSGASSGSSVESKITTPAPDPLTLRINVKGKAKDYDRFHLLADNRPTGYILRGYGELFSTREGVSIYEYDGKDQGKLFDKALKSTELKPKYHNRKRVKFIEGERNFHLIRQASDALWLNPDMSDRDIMNIAYVLEEWYEGAGYNRNYIAETIHKLSRNFDPSKKALGVERFINFNSDSSMNRIEKMIEQRAIKYQEAVLKYAKGTIELAIKGLIEARENKYHAITYEDIANFKTDGAHANGVKAKYSAATVRRRIQEDPELLKMLMDYNKGRYTLTKSRKMVQVEDALYQNNGFSISDLSGRTGIKERTVDNLLFAIRQHNDVKVVE